jgi:hypothetical protein
MGSVAGEKGVRVACAWRSQKKRSLKGTWVH